MRDREIEFFAGDYCADSGHGLDRRRREESEEREEVYDQLEEQYEVLGQEQDLDVYLDMEEEIYASMEDMPYGPYVQPPRGILNFRLFTALPKHNTRNITSLLYGSVSQGLGTTKFTNLIG